MPTPIVVRPPFRTRGQNWLPLSKNFVLAEVTGSGGVEIGGTVLPGFTHTGQVASDIVIEWDLDNDGDFSEDVEDITSYVLAVETTTGRDWPSLLTGKAGPGKFRATLNNADDRFSYFNMESPLNAAPLSLKTGRKLRVRTATAGNPDPVMYAKDRFGRSDGALGTPETGAAWSGPLTDDFVIVSQQARPQTEGAKHIAVIDVGQTEYYAQARLSEVGVESNTVGLVYRYQDANNYSYAAVRGSAFAGDDQLLLFNVVGGSEGGTSLSIEIYDEMTIGVLVSGGTATLYLEGIPVLSQAAIQSDETEVGIYADWGTGDVRPAVDDFYVWSGLPVHTEGILWTGDVSNISTSVVAGPEKYAILEGEGWLSRLATQTLRPIRSVEGRKTGIFVGNLLARTNLLHPPFMIDEGDVTTGPTALATGNALEAARKFEDVEFGFLRETQEGPVAFDSRSAREGSPVVVYMSDASGTQFGYTGIEPLNWRGEVVNRATAGVSAGVPTIITTSTFTDTGTDAALTMPSSALAGDLQIVGISVYQDSPNVKWLTPPGWKDLSGSSGEDIANAVDVFANELTSRFNRILARTVDRDWVTGDTFRFTDGLDTGDSYAARMYTIRDWFGSVEDGVTISDFTGLSGLDVPGDDPPAVFPPWGSAPSAFLAFCFGVLGSAGFTGSAPLGYLAYGKAAGDTTFEPFAESAHRFDAVEVENPGSFHHDYGGDTGWVEQSVVVAVRGDNGGLSNGVVTVQLDDLDSQADHSSIRTNPDPPEIFATEEDAEEYAQLMLDTYASDRPIVKVEFVASKSGAYRALAIRARVNDRIALVATNNAGLGISADFFIESINHRWSAGITKWETTWELSPA